MSCSDSGNWKDARALMPSNVVWMVATDVPEWRVMVFGAEEDVEVVENRDGSDDRDVEQLLLCCSSLLSSSATLS